MQKFYANHSVYYSNERNNGKKFGYRECFFEYDEIMDNDRLRGKLFFRIENVWKETNTVVMRGNAEKAETSAQTSDDKIILFPGKKY